MHPHREEKRGACVLARRVNLNGAAAELDDLFADDEAHADAFLVHRTRPLQLIERLKKSELLDLSSIADWYSVT